MKKILALVLFAAMMFAFAIPTMAVATIALPDTPKADIVIDGVKDDGYGEWYTLDKVRNGGEGATGKFCSAWNETGIFYYVEVYDYTPFHDHSNSYERDCVEFFIDWNAAVPDSNTQDDENPSWQLRIASAPNEDGNTNSATLGDDNGLEDKYFTIKPLEGNDLSKGYIMEVCLPISYTGGNAKPLAEGRKIFVDFQIADQQEEDGGRATQVFLDPEDDQCDSQWSTPEAFMGILNLVAAKAPAEVPTEAPGDNGGDIIAPPPPVPPKTGDGSAIMLIVLGMALAGAVVVTKRLGKNKA